MATPNHSRRGSMGYYPRKRAKKIVPTISTWPELDEGPKVQGFAGYKAGMTHAIVVDWRKKSTTANQEIVLPVTVIEVPPMKVCGIRFYERTTYGLSIFEEVWSANLNKELSRKISISKKASEKDLRDLDRSRVEEVRLIVYTQPYLVSSLPKKRPEIMEVQVGGGKMDDKIDYAIKLLGKEISFSDFSEPGKFVDVIAVTKGKGFQGAVKRFGVKLLPRKNRKHKRMVGTLGPWHPNYVMNTVPMAGQMGYQQRTEYNKRVIYYSNNNGESITPAGGFLNYGAVKNSYILVHGSVPGAVKRIIRFRDPIRMSGENVKDIKITYISKESKQGV
jgi:large subunit ribosomal protein L3